MDNILKPKTDRVSKTPIDRSVSADSVFHLNDDAQALDDTAGKCETKQFDLSKIQGKSPLFTDKLSTVTGSKEQVTDTPVKVYKNREPNASPMLQQNGSDAIIAASYRAEAGRETSELESVHEEDESVFDDDQLVFGDDALDYETSSVSVDIFTDRVLSESPTNEMPEEDVLDAHDSTGKSDNIVQSDEYSSTASGKSCHQSKTNGKSSTGVSRKSSKSDNKEDNKQSSDSAQGTQNVYQRQPDEVKTTETANETLQQSQVSGHSSAGSSEKSSLSGKTGMRDGDNEHMSDIVDWQHDAVAADNTGCSAADENLERRQISGKSSSLFGQKTSQTKRVSRKNSALLDKPGSHSSSCNDVNLYVASKNTPEDAALMYNKSTTLSKSRILSAGGSDKHTRSDSFHELACVDASNEERSTAAGKPRSLRSSSHSASSSAGSGHCQISAADVVIKTTSDVTATLLQQQYSSESSSDWHLATMLYEDSEYTAGRNSSLKTSSAKSSKSSVSSSSERHTRTLLEKSDLSARQMSGDLHARVCRPADADFFLPALVFL